MSETYDIAIIGAGPGGYVAALHAAGLGFKTVCIDKRKELGGTCLNEGCIPSKALLQSTEFLAYSQHNGKQLGVIFQKIDADFTQMMQRKETIVKGLTSGIAMLFKQKGVTFIQGEASFNNPHELQVKGESTETIKAKYFIIATGSEPIALPGIEFDEKMVLSSTGALSLKEVPKKLVVIGAGVIGVELASVYKRLGTEVEIVEMLDRICPTLDLSLSKQLHNSLVKQGIQFHFGSRLEKVTTKGGSVNLSINQEGKVIDKQASVVLIAVGRRPLTKGLNLDAAQVDRNERGFVTVDQSFRTTQPHIFAIGDAIDGVMLAHRASAEAVALVDSLKHEHALVNYLAVPNVIYTAPEVGTVGLTEEEANFGGIDKMIGTSYFKANPRARCMEETDGFVKIIGDKRSGRLVGMHIIGPHASELISQGVIAMQNRATVKSLADSPAAHPTLSETIKEAAEAACQSYSKIT